MKSIIKRVLGQSLSDVISLGMDALRRYPRYLSRTGVARSPEKAIVEVTYRCNARCRMCPLYGEHMDGQPMCERTADGTELSTEELLALLESSRALGVSAVTFTGGEPCLRKDLGSLVAHASGMGMRTHVITNGSLLTMSLADELVRAGLRTMDISVDGDAEVHDAIRRVPGLFGRVREGLGNLLEASRKHGSPTPHVTLACAISALNQHSLVPLVELAKDFDLALDLCPVYFTTPDQMAKTATIFKTPRVKPEDQNINEELLKVDVSALAQELGTVRALAQAKQVPFSCRLEKERDIVHRFLEPNHCEGNKCLFPWYALRIDPFGTVYPCSIGVRMGSIREQSLEAIWNGDAYRTFRTTLRRAGLFPSCAKCCVLNRRNVVLNLLPRI